MQLVNCKMNMKVKFILIDATPTIPDEKDSTKSKEVKPTDNVYCALYNEVQAGYLAGYAAVKGGFTNLDSWVELLCQL